MKGLTASESEWLSKYTRESWKLLPNGSIRIEGNITISDPAIVKFPFKFSMSSGIFKCKGCNSLISVEGAPTRAEEYVFENCLLPSEWYLEAIGRKISIENLIEDNFIEFFSNHKELLQTHFSDICHKHRGESSLKKFGA